MFLEFSVPSKTFISGEYLALFGGPSLLVCTEPRFKLQVKLGNHEAVFKGFHSKSPAGLLYKKHGELLKPYEIEFVDPIEGRGGLGASSAQFVLIYALIHFLTQKGNSSFTDLDVEHIWRTYREICNVGQKDWLPSGADVVAQVVGGLCQFEWKNFSIKPIRWNFEDLDFCILKTNKKVNTHDHLQNLGSMDLEAFKNSTSKTLSAMIEGDSLNFVTSLQEFYSALLENGLVCENTKLLVDQFNSSASVIGVKGCGALGADTLFVVCESKNLDSVKSLSRVVGLEFVSSLSGVSEGLTLNFKYEYNRQRQVRLSQKSSIQRVQQSLTVNPVNEMSEDNLL